ncbi:cupin domain-containing protein [Fischerella sp. JS2]|uniref:cupin domain-containing protein n=1 Tax=Fischerella sp. JS2 TaxID=2597771 RepID=UPI0028E61623|nr:cupin domain-containing protein [Fischerella sp. JS2]
MVEQTFIDTNNKQWLEIEQFPGTQILPLAEPIAQGSIHKLRMTADTVIPVHYHPCDEYVYVLKGIIETNGRQCTSGTFWFTPANTKNGPHKAITDVEIITIRLGEMGVFEEAST